MIRFNSPVVVPKHVLMRELDGEAVLLNLESEYYFGLDRVGTRIWSALTTAKSIQVAYEILLDEYEVTPEDLKRDMSHLIGELTEHGLLELPYE
jgi:hypothetical protein